MRKFISCSMGAVIGVTATLTAVNSSKAGAFPVDTVTMKTAAPQDIVEVRYRGGGALFAGLALGLMGAAIAGSSYYGPGYYYPSYYPGYAYAPYPSYAYAPYPSYAYAPYQGYAYAPYPYYGSYYGGYQTYAYSIYPRYRHYYRYRRHW